MFPSSLFNVVYPITQQSKITKMLTETQHWRGGGGGGVKIIGIWGIYPNTFENDCSYLCEVIKSLTYSTWFKTIPGARHFFSIPLGHWLQSFQTFLYLTCTNMKTWRFRETLHSVERKIITNFILDNSVSFELFSVEVGLWTLLCNKQRDNNIGTFGSNLPHLI